MDRKKTRRTGRQSSKRLNATLSRKSAQRLGLKLEKARAEQWAAEKGKGVSPSSPSSPSRSYWWDEALRRAENALGPIEPLEKLVPSLCSEGKRIVVLEDKKSRIDLFNKWFGSRHDLVQTAIIREGIEYLREKKADVLFLDYDVHDKGDATLREWLHVEHWRKELDGLDLATYAGWMSPKHRPATVVVHSRNPIGQKMLLEHLRAKNLDPVRWPFQYEWPGPDVLDVTR